MGHQFTIESDEAFALATELAALTGRSVDSAVTDALRCLLTEERRRQDNAARLNEVLKLAGEIRTLLGNPVPSLSTDVLYDPETGLPT